MRFLAQKTLWNNTVKIHYRYLQNIKNKFINKFCFKKSSNDGVLDSSVCIALELSLLHQPNTDSMQPMPLCKSYVGWK